MWADSLAAAAQRQIDKLGTEAGDPFAQRAQEIAFRGIAHALSGRSAEAIRDAGRAADLLPVSRDAVDAPRSLQLVAYCYILAGDESAAFRVLDVLASVPGPLSVASLRLNHVYDSLRDDPRYSELMRKLETSERSGAGTL
jgi:hypothetical protein